MVVPEHAVGKTVGDLDSTQPDNCILLLLRGNLLLPRPAADLVLEKGDTLLVAGLDDALDAFADS
jgi:Trk K+ transport system NAD-binding subunit